MTDRSITLTGPFTDEEFAAVVALIRNFDSRVPDRTFAVVMDDPTAGMDDAVQAVARALAEAPGRTTVIKTYRQGPGMPGSPGNVGC